MTLAVFVETNWVVDVIAPAHLQSPQAIQLLQSADVGQLTIFLPAICLAEARETVPRRFAPRSRSADLRKFVQWARTQGRLSTEEATTAFKVFEQFDNLVTQELTKVPERLAALKKHSGVNIFPISESMLERQVVIGSMGLSLKPYDLAILAAILVKAEELREAGYSEFAFCELDSDLQPWDRVGNRKPILSNLYTDAEIQVYGDFLVRAADDFPDDGQE